MAELGLLVVRTFQMFDCQPVNDYNAARLRSTMTEISTVEWSLRKLAVDVSQ